MQQHKTPPNNGKKRGRKAMASTILTSPENIAERKRVRQEQEDAQTAKLANAAARAEKAAALAEKAAAKAAAMAQKAAAKAAAMAQKTAAKANKKNTSTAKPTTSMNAPTARGNEKAQLPQTAKKNANKPIEKCIIIIFGRRRNLYSVL